MLLALVLMICLTCGECRHKKYLLETEGNVDNNWNVKRKNDVVIDERDQNENKKPKELQNRMKIATDKLEKTKELQKRIKKITKNKMKAKINKDSLKKRTLDRKMKNRKPKNATGGDDYFDLGKLSQGLGILSQGVALGQQLIAFFGRR